MFTLRPITLISARAAAASLMTGCAEVPPPPAPKDPVLLPYEQTADPVHVRTPSVYATEESRGGAAIRQEADKHVLWGEHAEGETNPAKLKAWQDELSGESAEAPRHGKDAAVYSKGKDASIYGAKKGKDASIYAKDRKGGR